MKLRPISQPVKLPIIDVQEGELKTVFANSELELKAQNPGVWAIKRDRRTGVWSGLLFN